jgi:hypothetical protein
MIAVHGAAPPDAALDDTALDEAPPAAPVDDAMLDDEAPPAAPVDDATLDGEAPPTAPVDDATLDDEAPPAAAEDVALDDDPSLEDAGPPDAVEACVPPALDAGGQLLFEHAARSSNPLKEQAWRSAAAPRAPARNHWIERVLASMSKVWLLSVPRESPPNQAQFNTRHAAPSRGRATKRKSAARFPASSQAARRAS